MANRYGIDTAYFERELDALKASLEDRTPEELARYLTTLAAVACSPWKKYPEVKPEKYQDCIVMNDLGKVFHAVFIKDGFCNITDIIIAWSPIPQMQLRYIMQD